MQSVEIRRSRACGFMRILFGPQTNVDMRPSHRPGIAYTCGDVHPGQAEGSAEEHLLRPASFVERRHR